MTTVVVPARRGWQETVAIVLLLIGGVFAGVGWLAGVILLWLSEVWTVRDKLIGTFVVPGGLALPIFLLMIGLADGSITSCTGGGTSAPTCTTVGGSPAWERALWLALMAACVVASIASAVHLARTSRAR